MKNYDFRKAHVHIIRADEDPPERLTCFRCHRRLKSDVFPPIDPTHHILRRFKITGIRSKVIYLHPWCMTCRRQSAGTHTKHPLYSPKLDRVFEKIMVSTNAGAKARDIVMGVTKDDVLGLYLEQNGICALTGMEMKPFEKGRKRARLRPSVDRIDNNGNYTMDNIQIVCSVVNIMKNDLRQEDFTMLCSKVVEHAFHREDELLEAIG